MFMENNIIETQEESMLITFYHDLSYEMRGLNSN